MSTPRPITHLKAIFAGMFSFLRAPESFAENLLESVSEWNRSRRWIWIWITVAFLVGNLGIWATAGFYAFRSRSSIVQTMLTQSAKRFSQDDLVKAAFEEHYIRNRVKDRSDADPVNANQDGDETGFKARPKLIVDDELITSDKFRESEIMLRRAYEISPDSTQAAYQLALLASLNTKNPNAQADADELMSELAANEADLFPPAHAWLAVSMIGGPKQLTPLEMNELEKHLKIASQWTGIESKLLSIYSQICFKAQQFEKALNIAKLAAENNPEFNLLYAQLCFQMGPQHESEFQRAVKAAEKAYSVKLSKPNVSDIDRLDMARIMLLQERNEKAFEILHQGISTEDPKANLPIRRGLADLHIDKFRTTNVEAFKEVLAKKKVVEQSGNSNAESSEAESAAAKDIDWSDLQEAAKFDRDNPIVGEEIAFQWRRMTMPPAELIEVLRYQLGNGLATTGARLMVAELYLLKGQVREAKQQWELIIGKNPNVFGALNNLAVILSRENPPQIGRALELIERAYRMDPMNAEMCDSYGEVFMNAGRPLDAIGKLEEAIRIEPRRIATRQRLATCYRELGMADMAEQQLKQIKLIEEERNLPKPEAPKPATEPSS